MINDIENTGADTDAAQGELRAPVPKQERNYHYPKVEPEAGDAWKNVGDKLPLEALPAIVREYAEALSRVHLVPHEVPVLAMLGTLSGAMGKGWKLSGVANGKSNYGNVYIVASLPPSSGKHVAEVVVSPFRDAEERRKIAWNEDARPRIKSKKERLEGRLKAARGASPKPDSVLSDQHQDDIEAEIQRLEKQLNWCPDLMSGDDTSAYLIHKVQHATDETMCIFSSEGGDIVQTLLGRFQEKGADVKFTLKAYSGDSHSSGRVSTAGKTIKEPIATMCIFVQPYVWNEILENKEAEGCGLLPRILMAQTFCPMPYDDGIQREVPLSVSEAWEKRIEEIIRQRVERGGDYVTRQSVNCSKGVQCSPAARELLRKLHNEAVELTNGPCADLRADLGRWRENAARLALVFAVAENPDCNEVTEEQAQRAVALLKWFAVRGIETRKEARDKSLIERKERLEGLLRPHGNQLTLRRLEKHHSFSAQEVQQIALRFPDRFRVDERRRDSGGLPSRVCVMLELSSTTGGTGGTGGGVCV